MNDPGIPELRTDASDALTHSQQQIWIGQRLNHGSPLYNMAFAFLFEEELDADVFVRAWQHVADASDALRTQVVETGGTPRRRLAPRAPATRLVGFDTDGVSEGEFRLWCAERAAQSLAVDGHLVDSVLVRLADGRTGWYLNQHHLITDAWSTVLLYGHVAAEYVSCLQSGSGTPMTLPSCYQTVRALPAAPGLRGAALEHWTARRRPAGSDFSLYGRDGTPAGTASTRLTIELDQRRSALLDARLSDPAFSSVSGDVSRFSLFAALLAGWQHRISGRREISFDAPVSGRPTPLSKRALGLFIELFPFSVEVGHGDTFRTLWAKCLDEGQRLLRHALPGTSTLSGTTSSGCVLNYIPGGFGPFAGLEPHVTWVHPGHGDSIHALRLQVHDLGKTGRLVLHFDFNDAALEDRLRRRSLEHFEKLLDGFLEGPDSPIAAVSILTGEERRALASMNDTAAAPLPVRTVVDMFEEQARLDPGRVALRQGGREVSFGELLQQADAMAAALRAQGVGPGDRVAIVCRRSSGVVAAILGTLKTRAAYVPVDPTAPQARLELVLDDSGARVLLADGRVPSGATHRLAALDIAAILRNPAEANAASPDGPSVCLDDLAYLMYTSGSSGRPKGVPIDHAGLADYLGWAERRYVRGDRFAYALFTSLAFDLTITSLFLPLITGGTLEIYPESEGPADSAVIDMARANAVDFVKLTPSHLSVLRRIGLQGSRIRRIVVGGEDLKAALALAVSDQLGGKAEIYNEYGPTEAVVGCVEHRFDPAAASRPSVPIGRPADHVRIEILDESGSPVPEGVPGELWVSRFGLARGYHHLEDLTAERFAAAPDSPWGRRYRTGDLVRLIDPSTLEYLGRIDRQLKVSGFRVEPGEVEAAMLSIPGVDACAVIAHRQGGTAAVAETAPRHCARCGLPSNFPGVDFDDDGVCGVCRSYETIRERAKAYFGTIAELPAVLGIPGRSGPGQHDLLMLYSGGKDSTYALCRLSELGYRVYAFTLDNGFISAFAKDNIRQVTARLGVPIEFATTPAMNAIFRDSLARFSNVCNGCFKTIYTLGMLRARELGIPAVVTGLSRGQMFETRLSEEVFGAGVQRDELDSAVLAARKAYHRTPDELARLIDVSAFQGDEIFDAVRVVDFYRYCDVSLEDMLAYLDRTVPWVRPADTGRSTNCLINELGIFVHKKERGYHSYALPYSWDVRLGHKSREAALEELDDDIDPGRVRDLMSAIGSGPGRLEDAGDGTSLGAFYVGALTEADVRKALESRLPAHLVPLRLERLDAIPLTANGKVDERALARDAEAHAERSPYVAPQGPVEEFLAAVWQQELGVARVGSGDSFFALGGTSLSAMRMVVRLCQEFDIDVPLAAVFTHPQLAGLARVAEDQILEDADRMDASSPSNPPAR